MYTYIDIDKYLHFQAYVHTGTYLDSYTCFHIYTYIHISIYTYIENYANTCIQIIRMYVHNIYMLHMYVWRMYIYIYLNIHPHTSRMYVYLYMLFVHWSTQSHDWGHWRGGHCSAQHGSASKWSYLVSVPLRNGQMILAIWLKYSHRESGGKRMGWYIPLNNQPH